MGPFCTKGARFLDLRGLRKTDGMGRGCGEWVTFLRGLTENADRESRQGKPTGKADRESRQGKPTGKADREGR